MKERTKTVGILLVVLFMSWLARLLAGNQAVVEIVKKVASVTWNS